MTTGRGLKAIAGSTMLVAAATVLLMLPAMSAARTTIVVKASTSEAITLKGSKGYSISIFGGTNIATHKGFVTLNTSKGKGNASYSATGTATPAKLKASFGGLGKISLKFHQIGKGKKTSPGPGCTGPKGTSLSGVWKGRIKFKGEHGYTRVNFTKARGTVVKSKQQTCHLNIGGNTHGVILNAGNAATLVNFSATRALGSSRATYVASSSETKGAVSIYRSIFLTGPASKFTANVGAGTATVKPPAPFRGTGNLAASNWTGSLRVSFPGKNNVRLAGAGFFGTLASQ
jgi:hypothetical protein